MYMSWQFVEYRMVANFNLAPKLVHKVSRNIEQHVSTYFGFVARKKLKKRKENKCSIAKSMLEIMFVFPVAISAVVFLVLSAMHNNILNIVTYLQDAETMPLVPRQYFGGDCKYY